MGQSVGLQVDPGRDEPIYRQIFDQVVRRIQSRAFPPGYKLPPSRTLARELAAHRNTVARAYADLEAAGFVSSTVGRGTFVTVPPASATPKAPAPEPHRGTVPWAQLLSRAARTESLSRAERYARRPETRDVINLARMQPSEDLLPSELIARCIDRVMSEHGARALTYAPPEGVHRLRDEIAKDLADRGVPANADDILITSGSQQALDLLARALVNPGDTILVDETTYSGAIDLFSLAGARLVSVPSDAQGPDLAALARFARPDVKALYLMPNGHNPTGLFVSAERRRALVAWSQSSGIPIIEDDYAAGLVLDDTEAAPYLRALDGDVIHLSSFSKRLIPALRVGFIVCPQALRGTLGSLKRVMDLGASAILQHALAEFMERGYLRAHMHRLLPEYRLRRDTLEQALTLALPSTMRFRRPSHGVVIWLPLPSGMDPDALYDEALRQGVLLLPNAMWSVDGRAQPGVRLTFCAETAPRLAEGARRLGKAIKILSGLRPKKGRAESPVIEAV